MSLVAHETLRGHPGRALAWRHAIEVGAGMLQRDFANHGILADCPSTVRVGVAEREAASTPVRSNWLILERNIFVSSLISRIQ